MSSDDNITFDIGEEDETVTTQYNLDDFLIDDPSSNSIVSNDTYVYRTVDYQVNYTVKQLLQICDYYGIAKDLRLSKCNKEFISNVLVEFESCEQNKDIVERRQLLWIYMDELKRDKFMKKYIFW